MATGRAMGRAMGTGMATETETEPIEQVLREIRPEEGVQKPSASDLRQNYQRYEIPG